MARKCYVGFWPWPRAWTTQEAYDVALTLKKDVASVHLMEPATQAQAEVFRSTIVEYIKPEFELQLCADGLMLYRDNLIEEKILEAAEIDKLSSDRMMGGFDAIMSASGAAYRHYIPALNVLFALVESELHRNGRNLVLYWAQPIGRTDMVRVKNAQSDSEQSSLTNFGAVNEMQIQRFADERSIGARVDGMYYKEVPGAFSDACEIFDKAYRDKQLWSFLVGYANAWTNMQTELHESSLALSWSLIERDLLEQTIDLLRALPEGGVWRLESDGTARTLTAREEERIRTRLDDGESPMAGVMIAILLAHEIPLHDNLGRVKDARNANQHSGTSVDYQLCRDALIICADICNRVFSVDLNRNIGRNPHLGITS